MSRHSAVIFAPLEGVRRSRALQFFFLGALFFAQVLATQADVQSLTDSSDSPPLKAITINTEWLWTPHDGRVDGEINRLGDMSPKAYESELRFYTELIQSTGANIVALQEIENESVANDLVSLLGKSWQTYFKQGRDTATGQDVAIISSLQPLSHATNFGFVKGYVKGQKKGKRLSKVVGVAFEHPSSQQPIWVVTTHWLSQRNETRKKHLNRRKQADALVRSLSNLPQRSALIILGDFNVLPNSLEMQWLSNKLSLSYGYETCGKSTGNRLNNKPIIDQILFRNLRCNSYTRHDLGKHSDHDAVSVVFY